MNTRLIMIALLSAIALPVAAQAVDPPQIKVVVSANQPAGHVTVAQLANETGLDERQVRMVVGARTVHANYRYTFDRNQRRFREALGEERYRDLMAGRPIPLFHQGDAGTGDRTLVADVDTGPERP